MNIFSTICCELHHLMRRKPQQKQWTNTTLHALDIECESIRFAFSLIVPFEHVCAVSVCVCARWRLKTRVKKYFQIKLLFLLSSVDAPTAAARAYSIGWQRKYFPMDSEFGGKVILKWVATNMPKRFAEMLFFLRFTRFIWHHICGRGGGESHSELKASTWMCSRALKFRIKIT